MENIAFSLFLCYKDDLSWPRAFEQCFSNMNVCVSDRSLESADSVSSSLVRLNVL